MLDKRLVVGAAFAFACLAGCGSTGASTTPTASTASVGIAGANLGTPTVRISATGQLTFDPATQTAHVGDIIQWSNTGSVEHTVTFDSQPSLSDPSLQPGGTWEVKFTSAGTYQYHCTIHANMVGSIVVS